MPQQTPEAETIRDSSGRIVGYKGAGAVDRSDEIERERWKREKGLAGIGNASKASKPENKTALEEHMKEWKASRAANTGQKKAVEDATKTGTEK